MPILTLLVAILIAAPMFAAPPELDGLFPAGASRGSEVTVQILGKAPDGPFDAITTHESISISAHPDQPGMLQVRVDEAAPVGRHWVRLVNAEGASRAHPFVVSSVVEHTLKEDDQGLLAVDLDHPCVVNSRLEKNDRVDRLQFDATEGELLWADLVAHRVLGSPMDAVLQLVSLDDQAVLFQSDDYHGLDPLIRYRVSKTGRYELRVFAFPETPTSRIGFAGGNDFVYRLRLTKGAAVESAFPLVCARDQTQSAKPIGPGEWTDPTIEYDQPRDAYASQMTLAVPQVPGWADVLLVDQAAVLHEQNDVSADDPLPVSSSCWVTGCLAAGDDEDTLAIPLRESEEIEIMIDARRLHFPWDPVLEIFDAAGKSLQKNDDADRSSRDAKLDFKAPSQGTYYLRVTDLHGESQDDFFYRLELRPKQPSYSLELSSEHFVIPEGETLELPVTINRRHGYAEPIHVSVVDLPPDVSATTAVSVADSESKDKVTIKLSSRGAARGEFRVIGTTQETRQAIRATTAASVPDATWDSFQLIAQ